ncbi:MAG: glycoside hydrolase family 3 C-terminal domain-containing protein [Lachnospiraceae bacterium]|nr:glycoside hydrolase family 3 C-terminal domain-containing protein [Lachnospiraceae bacterium]
MRGKKKGTGILKWSIVTSVMAILLVVALAGSYVAFSSAQAINIALKIKTNKMTNPDDNAVYFASDFDSADELEAYDKKIAEQLTGEGAVLLKNDNGALPLRADETISCFSHSSVDIATCGTGSADIDTSKAPTLKEALESRGFQVNPLLWSFYLDGAGKDYTRMPVKGMSGLGSRDELHVNEVPASAYTDEIKSSFKAFGDVALVTLTRVSGELFDLPVDEFVDGTNGLELTQEEQDMFKTIQDNGFKKTVVLINSTNPLECDFLFDDTYGVDAALWIGYTGTWGLNAVSDILAGNVNPSGRLVDTFCKDNTTAPSMVDFYGHEYANADNGDERWYSIATLDGNTKYTIYQEGIYVGYRYYETRYEDTILGQGNTAGYDYTGDVAYPFGYGLSYTDFQWDNYTCSYDEAADAFVVSVKVTNAGDSAGKDAVQIYFQSPYTGYDKANGIEKASVELCGFGKTQILNPGDSETITVTVPREELAAYDYKNAKTYILDAGEYYLTAATNAHDAVNNILAVKGYTTANGMDQDGSKEFVESYTNDTLDTTTYAVSSATGTPVTNQFDDGSLHYYGEEMTVLSRKDWSGTWPEVIDDLEASEEMMKGLNIYQTYQKDESDTTPMPVMGEKNNMTLAMMIGKDYDDPQWEALLDQMTYDEMALLIGEGYHNTALMTSVSKPATLDDNGPQGFTQSLTGIAECHCAYSDENIMAATYNVDLMEAVGTCIGNDVLELGASGLYGPAMNTHRNAYAGRNFEYYSEDGFLAGKIAAAEIRGIQSKGVYVYIKHFALNDSETGCRCISTWADEQSIREIYLKPFQTAVVEGGAYNVMNAFARIGTTWAGAHGGLMTDVLRNEWGMRGFAITDFSGNSALAARGIMLKSYDVVHGLLAGTDTWDSSAVQWTNDLLNLYKGDAVVTTAMREASHRILYTVANSNAMNGISTETRIVGVIPWWKTAIAALDTVLAVLTILSAVMLVSKVRKSKKAKAEETDKQIS